MRQIHHVQVSMQDRWVLDEHQGAVKRREQIMHQSSTARISHEGEIYEVDPEDGSFLVPDSLATLLLNTPGWHEGASPFAGEVKPSPAELRARKAAPKAPEPTSKVAEEGEPEPVSEDEVKAPEPEPVADKPAKVAKAAAKR